MLSKSLIKKAEEYKLVFQVYNNEIFFVPISKNYFTRIRKIDTDYYIEYCDDYKNPLDNTAIVLREQNYPPNMLETGIIHYILKHPKN
jgi:hypothetical protein